MAHRNVHQGKKTTTRKAVPAVKPAAQPLPVKPIATTGTAKPASLKTQANQEAAAMRFAELPYELRRIALFSAFVVVLLLVLWFFLK